MKDRIDNLNTIKYPAPPGEPDCAICRNNRYIFFESNGYRFTTDCKCKKEVDSYNMLKQSGLYEYVKNYTFENYKTNEAFQKKIKEKALNYIINYTGQWFAILGQSGAGKTHICTAICLELIKRGKSVKYLRWNVELKELKVLANTELYQSTINNYMHNDVIYIDDILKRSRNAEPSDADVRLLFDLINYALQNKTTLILSGEDTLENLIYIDEAIAGRIYDMCRKSVLQIKPDIKRNYRFCGVLQSDVGGAK